MKFVFMMTLFGFLNLFEPALFALGSKPKSGSIESVVVALKPDKNPDRMMKQKTDLEQFLKNKLRTDARVMIPLSSAVILEGFRNQSVDVGFLSSVDMVNAAKSDLAEVLLAVDFDGKQSYQSYWLTLKDSPFQSVRDLKGKKIAFSSRTSTSGYLIPYWALIESGLLAPKKDPEEFFGQSNVWYGSGYVSAVMQVLHGQAEAAAVSDYVFDSDRYLSSEQKLKLRVLDRQGPVPSHMIAVRRNLNEDEKKRLREAFLALNESEFKNLRNQLFESRLVPVNQDKHLESTRKALEVVHGKF
jgi:phosphonate transport system substrate-binding protein